MANDFYLLGVFLAIIAGVISNIGLLIQKNVINKHLNEKDQQFMVNLVKNPLWISGLVLQVVIGGLVFYFLAILFIGPAIVTGLMASGLIVLAIGSAKLLNERLEKEEVIGIALMIVGVSLLGFSELSLDVSRFDILNSAFILRLVVFTIIIAVAAIALEIYHRRINTYKGILLAIEAGLVLSLNTVWASPGTTIVSHLINGNIVESELIFGIFIGIILLVVLTIGITVGQISLKYGQANIIAPITNAFIQIVPVLAFFIVFLGVPSTVLSVFLMISGLSLITVCSFLLSKKQTQLEEISIE